MSVKLTPRLLTAVPYVRGKGMVADIGTDHAYLPIFLCESGRLPDSLTPCAIAADINRGPVERAEHHIRAAGLAGRIRTVQTDGLHGLEGYDPADIILFGMGGELIASILSAAPWAHRPLADGTSRRFILQPMTHADRLRAYLMSAGLCIVGETLSREGERIYQTLCVETTPTDAPQAATTVGTTSIPADTAASLTPAELVVGQAAHHTADPEERSLYIALIDKTLRTETAARDARRQAGQNTAEADALIASLAALKTQLS